MCIDSLTITAIVVFVVALALFISNCLMKDCGSGYRDIADSDNGEHHYKV
jgi:hypothetical protein